MSIQRVSASRHAFTKRDFTAAESLLRRALQTSPQNDHARLLLAPTLLQNSQPASALRELRQVLTSSRNPDIRFQAGRLLQDLGDARVARLQQLAPDGPATQELVGRSLEAQGKLDEALASYQVAHTLHPAALGLRFLIGNLHFRKRNYPQAAEVLRAELQLNPHHAQANLRLGQTLLAQAHVADAVRFLQEAVRGSPDLVEARRELGKALRQAERPADALPHLQFVVLRRHSDDSAHYQLALVYQILRNAEAAKAELTLHRRILHQEAEATQQHGARP